MTIYDRFVLYLLEDLYWEARSREARRRHDRRRMRAYDIEAYREFYAVGNVERLRPITFNPWSDILIERYQRIRKSLARDEGLYEELGYPYNL